MKFIVNGAVDVGRPVYRVPGLRCCGVVGVDMGMGIYLGIWIETKMKRRRARAVGIIYNYSELELSARSASMPKRKD